MRRLVVGFLAAIVLLIACSSEKIITTGFPSDGKYDTFELSSGTSQKFAELWQSVKLINSIAYYTSYKNIDEKFTTYSDLKAIDSDVRKWDKTFFTDNAAGTATILSNNNGNILFATCAHILNFPDTITTYYSDEKGKKSPYVESISIKVDQDNFISDLPGDGSVEIVVMDNALDIAIVGGKFDQSNLLKHRIIQSKFGNSDELAWGNYVYVVGYPMNRKMITKGLVSLYESNPNDYFLIDAVFNRGMSGGVVLAVRDGSPNFEFVGMVKSSPADSKIVIKPYNFENEYFNYPQGPFKGKLKIERELELKYGISKVLTINSILNFISDNEEIITQKGFVLPAINFQ